MCNELNHISEHYYALYTSFFPIIHPASTALFSPLGNCVIHCVTNDGSTQGALHTERYFCAALLGNVGGFP